MSKSDCFYVRVVHADRPDRPDDPEILVWFTQQSVHEATRIFSKFKARGGSQSRFVTDEQRKISEIGGVVLFPNPRSGKFENHFLKKRHVQSVGWPTLARLIEEFEIAGLAYAPTAHPRGGRELQPTMADEE